MREIPSEERNILGSSLKRFEQRFLAPTGQSNAEKTLDTIRRKKSAAQFLLKGLQENIPPRVRNHSAVDDSFNTHVVLSPGVHRTSSSPPYTRRKVPSTRRTNSTIPSVPKNRISNSTTSEFPRPQEPSVPFLPGISINNPKYVFFNVNVVVNNGKVQEPVTDEPYSKNCSRLQFFTDPRACILPKPVETDSSEVLLAHLKQDETHNADESDWPAYVFPSKHPKTPGSERPLKYSYNCQPDDIFCVYPAFIYQRKTGKPKENKKTEKN